MLIHSVDPLSSSISVNSVLEDRDETLTRLQALPAHMRRHDHIVKYKERTVPGKRFHFLNIQAGDKEVADVIRTLPAFQKDGKFSEELYAEYRNKYHEVKRLMAAVDRDGLLNIL